MRVIIVLVALMATQVAAQSKPVAPEYYLSTVIAMSLAEQYAGNCPVVEVNNDAIADEYGVVLTRLEADGIPTEKPHEHMDLPPQAETDAIIYTMLERNQAAADPAASFCTEAKSEIAEGSIVGGFLKVTGS